MTRNFIAVGVAALLFAERPVAQPRGPGASNL